MRVFFIFARYSKPHTLYGCHRRQKQTNVPQLPDHFQQLALLACDSFSFYVFDHAICHCHCSDAIRLSKHHLLIFADLEHRLTRLDARCRKNAVQHSPGAWDVSGNHGLAHLHTDVRCACLFQDILPVVLCLRHYLVVWRHARRHHPRQRLWLCGDVFLCERYRKAGDDTHCADHAPACFDTYGEMVFVFGQLLF